VRYEFMEPIGGVTAESLEDALLLVGITIPLDTIARWSHMEQVIAYDWAIRCHFRASDNQARGRAKPYLVTLAEHEGWPLRICTPHGEVYCQATAPDGTLCHDVIGTPSGLTQVKSPGQLHELVAQHASQVKHVTGTTPKEP
jgi:hypothetical protein